MADEIYEFNYWKFRVVKFEQRVSDNSADGLVLPRTFVKNLKYKLQGKVLLKTASGEKWEVDANSDNGVVLLKGAAWDEFAKAHGLNKNDNLIFKYCGNHKFRVSMFDGKTKMEKACSHFVRRLELGMINSETRNNEKEASKRKNDRSIVRRSGRKRAQNMTDHKEEEEEDTFDSLNQGKKASTNVAGKMIKVSKGAKVCKVEELESKQRVVQWTMKKACKGKKKVGLKVVMSPSYIHPGYSLVISSNWAKEQGLLKKQEVELRFEGKTWEAVFFCNTSNKLAGLTNGWKDFRMDNDLKVGDECFLNVVRGSSHPVAIDVLISRGTDGNQS